MTTCTIPSLKIYIGGPSEDIAAAAERMNAYFVLERDQEGRYLRDYQETTQNIVCAYSKVYDATVLKYTGPNVSYFSSKIEAAIHEANKLRGSLRESMSEDAAFYSAFCPTLSPALVERVVNLWDVGQIVITHCNDTGGEVTSEIYTFGATESVRWIVEAIEDVSSPYLCTREDIERSVQEWCKAEYQPSDMALRRR